MEDYKGEDCKILILYKGKLYQIHTDYLDVGYVLDLESMNPVEITTHLTDKGITYTITKDENDNG